MAMASFVLQWVWREFMADAAVSAVEGWRAEEQKSRRAEEQKSRRAEEQKSRRAEEFKAKYQAFHGVAGLVTPPPDTLMLLPAGRRCVIDRHNAGPFPEYP
jgi:hypothetical protein